MASAYVKFDCFAEDFLTAKHNFDTDAFHIVLTNTEPVAATDRDFSDIVEITAEHGYTSGGEEVTVSLATVSAEAIVTGTPIVFAAAGGAFGPFRYAVLMNYTHPDQVLICYWDYGSSISLLDTEELTLVFDAIDGIFKVV